MASTSAVAVSLTLPAQSEAANPVIAFIGRAAFAGAISWFVGKALDRAFPTDSRELDLRQVKNPRPTGRAFHDRYASNWQINNKKVHIPFDPGKRFGVGHFTNKELNGHELLQLQREEEYYGGAPIPLTNREPVSEVRSLKKLGEVYGLPYSIYLNDYQRRYFSPAGVVIYGFGITFTASVKICSANRCRVFLKGQKAHLLG